MVHGAVHTQMTNHTEFTHKLKSEDIMHKKKEVRKERHKYLYDPEC